jgi:hypothetical protein
MDELLRDFLTESSESEFPLRANTDIPVLRLRRLYLARRGHGAFADDCHLDGSTSNEIVEVHS